MESEDGVLVATIRAVAHDESLDGLDVTLWVSGAVVSGRLISPRAWAALMAVHPVTQALGEELLDAFGEGALADRQLDLVHLSDMSIITGTTVTTVGGLTWRGRLDRIDGWAIGRLEQDGRG